MATEEEKINFVNGTNEMIYADHIISFNIGSSITKLLLGVETSIKNEVNVSKTIVLPTLRLIEAIEFMLTQIQTNQDLSEKVREDLDRLQTKFADITTSKKS